MDIVNVTYVVTVLQKLLKGEVTVFFESKVYICMKKCLQRIHFNVQLCKFSFGIAPVRFHTIFF